MKSVLLNKKNDLFAKAADCYFAADTFDPMTSDLEVIECQHNVNQSVWGDFKKIRDNGSELKDIFSKIDVPVINIHGTYDPHIIEGIQPFLESCIRNTQLFILDKCGHYPWIEREAKYRFFEIIRENIG